MQVGRQTLVAHTAIVLTIGKAKIGGFVHPFFDLCLTRLGTIREVVDVKEVTAFAELALQSNTDVFETRVGLGTIGLCGIRWKENVVRQRELLPVFSFVEEETAVFQRGLAGVS